MATERDVYQLDTQDAVRSLQELGRAYLALSAEAQKNIEKTETLASVMKENLASSFMTAQAQFALLTSAYHAVVNTIAEGMHEWEENANAVARLGVVLRNTGADVEVYTRRFEAQQKQIEKSLGIDEAYVANLQTVILTMGISADQTERVTAASIQLSKLMGGDAVAAAKLLAKAEGEGKDELKRYGIQLDDVIEKGGGFNAILAEVERRTSGVTSGMTEYTQLTNRQAAAWGDVKKAAGGFFAEFYVWLNNANGFQKVADSAEKIRTAMADARTLELMSILKNSGAIPKNSVSVDVGPIEDITKETKEKADAAEKALMARLKREGQLYSEERSLRDENAKSEADSQRKAVEQANKWMEEGSKERDDLEKQAGETTTKTLNEQAEKEEQIWKEMRANMARADQEALEKSDKFWQSMVDQAENYMQQMAGTMIGFLGDMLQENTKFNHEMFELQVERETVGMSETEALAKRAEMENDMRDNKIASFEKELAASLISIAKDAAIKALFEGAAAVGSAAIYDYDGAAQHGIAAGLYAGVAVAAGGAGYALSSSRGMTSDEKARLDDAKKAKTDREERDKKQAKAKADDSPAQITVVYMGIAGTTELEQAKELERLRGEYSKLKTGSK